MSKIEEQVIDKIRKRAEAGEQKYGLTMERGDLFLRNWLVHAQEETMDLAVYIEKALEQIEIERTKTMMLMSVCVRLQESAAYWSEYDVPIGIVDQLNEALELCQSKPIL